MAAALPPHEALFDVKYMRLFVRVKVLGSSTKVRLSPHTPPKLVKQVSRPSAAACTVPEAPLPPVAHSSVGPLVV